MSQGNVINRFTDADKEPTKTLTPIEGYEKKDLVSLENALSEIEPPVHSLQTMVWTAKRNSRNPSDGLTSNESASIHIYTLEWPEAHQSIYTLLNEKLRSEKRNGPSVMAFISKTVSNSIVQITIIEENNLARNSGECHGTLSR